MPLTQHGLPFVASDTSREAAVRAAKFVGVQGREVSAWARQQGASGVTQKECSAALGLGRPSVCARFWALEIEGVLVKTSERREGCAVYLHREFA